jgi:hypothetical protein
MKATKPAMNGKIIIINPASGLSPITLKSLGLAASCENTAGFEADLINMAISSGTAPIVFATIKTTANIRKYLQKLFLLFNVDSRWFIVKY